MSEQDNKDFEVNKDENNQNAANLVDPTTPIKNDFPKLFIYGSGDADQLGPTGKLQSKKPIEIPLPLPLPQQVSSVSCGAICTAILTNIGNVYTFGASDEGALGRDGDSLKVLPVELPHPVTNISFGDYIGIAYNLISNDLFAWGSFKCTKGRLTTPLEKPRIYDNSMFEGQQLKKVLCGNDHVVILTQEGNVFCFGNSEFSQTGISFYQFVKENTEDNNPNSVKEDAYFKLIKLSEQNVDDIFVGGNHSFLLQDETKDNNNANDLNKNDTLNGNDIDMINPGHYGNNNQIYDLENRVTKNQILKAWGHNGFYQLGIDAPDLYHQQFVAKPTQVQLPKEIKVSTCSGGEKHSVCLSDEGRLFVWGFNDEHQCCESGEKEIKTPTEIQLFQNFGNEVNAVYARDNFTYAVNFESKKFYSWGYVDGYSLGNLKDGETETKPFLIPSSFFGEKKNIIDFDLGSQHVALVMVDSLENNTATKQLSERKSNLNINNNDPNLNNLNIFNNDNSNNNNNNTNTNNNNNNFDNVNQNLLFGQNQGGLHVIESICPPQKTPEQQTIQESIQQESPIKIIESIIPTSKKKKPISMGIITENSDNSNNQNDVQFLGKKRKLDFKSANEKEDNSKIKNEKDINNKRGRKKKSTTKKQTKKEKATVPPIKAGRIKSSKNKEAIIKRVKKIPLTKIEEEDSENYSENNHPKKLLKIQKIKEVRVSPKKVNERKVKDENKKLNANDDEDKRATRKNKKEAKSRAEAKTKTKDNLRGRIKKDNSKTEDVEKEKSKTKRRVRGRKTEKLERKAKNPVKDNRRKRIVKEREERKNISNRKTTKRTDTKINKRTTSKTKKH